MDDTQETLPHGTAVRTRDGRVLEVRTVHDEVLATLSWDRAKLVSATVTLPCRDTISIVADTGEHPIFGPVDGLCDAAGQTLARFGRVDWARPQWIPPLDLPGALPPGAGAAVLNLVAIAARNADVARMRYRGPYPTAMLFDALATSFFVEGDVATAVERFTSGVEQRAALGDVGTAAVDFVPAPFEWSWPHSRVCVQRRGDIERIYVDGVPYESRRRGPRRVVHDDDGQTQAVVVLGDVRWASVVTVQPDGRVTDAPRDLPTAPTDLVGTSLPPGVAGVLAGVIAGRAAAALQGAIREILSVTPLRWGATGSRIVTRTGEAIEIHAGLVAALPTESSALLEVLIGLVEPLILRLAQAQVASEHASAARR